MELNEHTIDLAIKKQKIMKDYNLSQSQIDNLKSLSIAFANRKYDKENFYRVRDKANNPSDKPFFKFGKTWVNSGTVVLLKAEEEICNKYDPNLKKLIDTGHRFTIGINFNQKAKANGIAVHLLSTSDKCNVKYKNGVRLYGDYSKYSHGKDVFMDMNTIWVIKKNCIKSIEYVLESDDRYLILHTLLDVNFRTAEYKLGIIDSPIILNDFEDFKILQTITYTNEAQEESDDYAIRCFIWDHFNYLRVKRQIVKHENGEKLMNEDLYKMLLNIIKYIDKEEKDLTIAQKDQLMADALYSKIKELPKEEYINIVKDIKRGYLISEQKKNSI